MFGETLGVDGGTFAYGYVSGYGQDGALGEALMYYYQDHGWYGVGPAHYDEQTGALQYEWPAGYIVYVP